MVRKSPVRPDFRDTASIFGRGATGSSSLMIVPVAVDLSNNVFISPLRVTTKVSSSSSISSPSTTTEIFFSSSPGRKVSVPDWVA